MLKKIKLKAVTQAPRKKLITHKNKPFLKSKTTKMQKVGNKVEPDVGKFGLGVRNEAGE